MKKIGTTSSGSVIVEMTAAQFDALSQFQSAPVAQPAIATMSIVQKVAYVRERILKLNPKKKEALTHSISSMFQFTGGIAATEIEEIIVRLQKDKFLSIDEIGRVKYKTANQSLQPTAPSGRG